MIVISGALVLVALVLLVVGIVGTGLGFVYGSIAVSLVSLGFLIIGIAARRGETLPDSNGSPRVGAVPGAADDAAPAVGEQAVDLPRPDLQPLLDDVPADEPSPRVVTPAETTATVQNTPAPVKKLAPARKPAPLKKTAPSAAGTSAAPAGRRAGSVVVIPDRGRFHRPECRYVRGVDTAETLSRAAATRQGYDACGVCKP